MPEPTQLMTQDQYDRLRKLISMLSSPSDGEVLNAVGAISRILNMHGLDWSELLLPRKLLPVRVASDDALDPASDDAEPVSLGKATVQHMYQALMNSPNVSAETRRDLRDYAAEVKGGSVTPRTRADIQAMYNYAIVGRRMI